MFRFHASSSSPGHRARLRAEASRLLHIAAARLSPDETRRFVAEVHEQLKPQPTSGELITAFLNGGIPAVIHKLS